MSGKLSDRVSSSRTRIPRYSFPVIVGFDVHNMAKSNSTLVDAFAGYYGIQFDSQRVCLEEEKQQLLRATAKSRYVCFVYVDEKVIVLYVPRVYGYFFLLIKKPNIIIFIA